MQRVSHPRLRPTGPVPATKRARPRRGFRPDLFKLEGRALLASWVNQGPAPTFGGQDEGIVGTGTAQAPTNPVSGGVEAVAAQPGNADIVYVGTTNGGVWKTTNATAVAPTWTPLTDNQVSLSSGDVKFAPNDPTYQTLYVGTGSFSSSGQDGTPGRGLLKTTDGGTTWTNLNPNGIFDGRKIKSVVPTSLLGGNVLLVGTFTDGGGVYRSTDGGTTFARLSGDGTSGLPAAGVSILVPDPSSSSVIYAGVPSYGVYRSDDGGATWAAKDNGLVSPTSANTRVELVASPAAPGDVFVSLLRAGIPIGFYHSSNSGDTWTPMDLAGTNEPGGFVGTNPGEEANDEEPPGGQGGLHFALLADPTNPNVVYVSGDRQNNPFPNSIGARNFSGRVFRGNAALPAGQQWTPITNNAANPNGVVGGTSPHADSRDMTFDANGNILQGNDGGIFRLVNPGGTATTREWVSVIGNLRNTEFISTGYSSLTHTALGGAQDTGSPIQISTNPADPWAELLQADGGIVGVDDTSTPGRSIRYTSSQFFGFFNRSTWDATNRYLGATQVKLIVNGTGGQNLFQYDNSIQFYQPFKLNAVDPTRMVIGTTRIYESTNQGDNLNNLGTVGRVYSMAYGGRYRGIANPDILYVGSYNISTPHLYVRTTAGGPLTDVEASYAAAGGFVARDIVLDPQNDRRAFAVDLNNGVFATFNAGATWVNITGNVRALAPGGTSDLRSIAFIGNSANYDTAVLAVGGYGGVYSTQAPGLAGTTPTWAKLGDSMSNALVDSLNYNIADDVLLAGTLGRGSWTLTHPTATTPPIAPPGGPQGRGIITVNPAVEGTPTPFQPLLPDAPIVPPSPAPRGNPPAAPAPDPLASSTVFASASGPAGQVFLPTVASSPVATVGLPDPTPADPTTLLIGRPAGKRKGPLALSTPAGVTTN